MRVFLTVVASWFGEEIIAGSCPKRRPRGKASLTFGNILSQLCLISGFLPFTEWALQDPEVAVTFLRQTASELLPSSTLSEIWNLLFDHGSFSSLIPEPL